jgi:pantetheine-phosphate adenylyltransferase
MRASVVRTAVYPGSFDPFHLGHLEVVQCTAEMFDEVLVAVLINPAKLGLLAPAERVDLIEESTTHLPNVRGLCHEGLTLDLARREGADVIVRAAGKEVRNERTMAATNEAVSGIRTCFVAPQPATAAISSSLVRMLLATGRHDGIRPLVPAPVFDALVAGH